jgi:hypothetical protein
MARNRAAAQTAPLGSLTQRGARGEAQCVLCLSERVTRISMELTDGSQVDFTHCLDCEHRSWAHGEELISVDHVLAKAQRER